MIEQRTRTYFMRPTPSSNKNEFEENTKSNDQREKLPSLIKKDIIMEDNEKL